MEEEERSWRDPRSNVRTGLGLGFEVGANSILDLFSFDPTGASQYAGGTFINYLAQKIRGGEISQGELVAAGLTSLIPGGAQARALTRGGRFATSVAKGGLSGGITTTSMSLLDEKELPSFGELAGGVTGGGLLGGAFDLAPATFTGKLGTEVSQITDDTLAFTKALKHKISTGKGIIPDFIREGGVMDVGSGAFYGKSGKAQYPEDSEFGLGKTIKEQDDALMERYKEITNPDSRVTDTQDPNYGSLISDATAASDEYGRSARAFYNLSRVSRKGRIFDLRTGEFNLKELKRRYPSDADADFRREVQALAADERFGIGTFKRIRGEQLEDWIRGIEDIAPHINSKEFETHHIRSIRHVGALLDGMTRKERVKFNNIMLKKMFYVGNNPENLILLNKKAHTRLHDKLNNEIGKYAQKYIDPDVVYTFEEKIEIAEKMGEIINRLTFEAYEEVADFMAEKFTIASPSARMAADIDIAELEARIDFVLDEYFRYLNQDGLGVIQSRIKELDYETEVRQVQQDTEPPDRRLWRLKRGKGKKTLERIKKFEELYGKQLKLNI